MRTLGWEKDEIDEMKVEAAPSQLEQVRATRSRTTVKPQRQQRNQARAAGDGPAGLEMVLVNPMHASTDMSTDDMELDHVDTEAVDEHGHSSDEEGAKEGTKQKQVTFGGDEFESHLPSRRITINVFGPAQAEHDPTLVNQPDGASLVRKRPSVSAIDV
mmetsp:Transcript_30945/g.53197  ORF Transcript_30945/g.53197 Transcript_30945/m.53197 type:complete len:159 (-) Transcript_30945:21-497(-)